MTRPHSAMCVDDNGKVECVCGLDDRPAVEPLKGQTDLADLWFGDRPAGEYDPDDRDVPSDYWRDEL